MNPGKQGARRWPGATIALGVSLSLLYVGGLHGQEGTAEIDLNTMYLKDQSVVPAYEGWWQNEDGTYDLFYGYMNLNWEQELDVTVGPDNYFAFVDPASGDRPVYDPSVADRGQPTHLYPRRNPFLFTVRVPEDFGDQELVWTLTANGRTHRVYGHLALAYGIDPQTISTETGGAYGSLADALRTNIPPELRVEGDMQVSVQTGEPLTLVAFASDPDNLPERELRGMPETLEDLYQPFGGSVVRSQPGLWMSWMVYRGSAGEVTFDPTQMKTWMDTRHYANSPWSPPYVQVPEPPPDGRWVTQMTFDEPGEYVLRAVARDGAMFTYEDVAVTVTR